MRQHRKPKSTAGGSGRKGKRSSGGIGEPRRPGGVRTLPAQHFQALFEATPDPCLVLDTECRIVALNEAFLRVTRTRRAEMVGRSLIEAMTVNLDDPSGIGLRNLTEMVQRALEKRVTDVMEVQRFDVRVPAAEGGGFEERFWSLTSVPVEGMGKDTLHIVLRIQDVTRFVHLREERAEQGEALVTTEVAEMFERSQEEAEVSLQLKRAYEELERRNDKLRELNRCMSAEAAARQQVQEALHYATLELERSNAELELFASVISHDLLAPLRTITSYTELLQSKYQATLDSKGAGYLAYIVDGAVRMRTMINDLLNYSRVAVRAPSLQPVQMDLVLDQALGNLASSLSQSGAQVTREEMPEVEGDLSQLTQLMQNLLANAVVFRRKEIPLRIAITRRLTEREWIFGVSDNGIGIESRFLERVFEPFRRLHTREEYEGSGMGLAICKKIVERHGGRMWVESMPRQGATFFFTLPARKER